MSKSISTREGPGMEVVRGFTINKRPRKKKEPLLTRKIRPSSRVKGGRGNHHKGEESNTTGKEGSVEVSVEARVRPLSRKGKDGIKRD